MKHKGAHSNIWIVDARWRDDTAPLSSIRCQQYVIGCWELFQNNSLNCFGYVYRVATVWLTALSARMK